MGSAEVERGYLGWGVDVGKMGIFKSHWTINIVLDVHGILMLFSCGDCSPLALALALGLPAYKKFKFYAGEGTLY